MRFHAPPPLASTCWWAAFTCMVRVAMHAILARDLQVDTDMRQFTRCAALQVASASDLEPFVLFLDGQPTEKRHLTNADQLLPKLKETFTGAWLMPDRSLDCPRRFPGRSNVVTAPVIPGCS